MEERSFEEILKRAWIARNPRVESRPTPVIDRLLKFWKELQGILDDVRLDGEK